MDSTQALGHPHQHRVSRCGVDVEGVGVQLGPETDAARKGLAEGYRRGTTRVISPLQEECVVPCPVAPKVAGQDGVGAAGIQRAQGLCQRAAEGGAEQRAVGPVDANVGLDGTQALGHPHQHRVFRCSSTEGEGVQLSGLDDGALNRLAESDARRAHGLSRHFSRDERPKVQRQHDAHRQEHCSDDYARPMEHQQASHHSASRWPEGSCAVGGGANPPPTATSAGRSSIQRKHLSFPRKTSDLWLWEVHG